MELPNRRATHPQTHPARLTRTYSVIRKFARRSKACGGCTQLSPPGAGSRASARPAAGFLLRGLSAHDCIDFRYRQHGRVLSATLRMAALQSDLLVFYEVGVYDCYRVPSWFHPTAALCCARTRWVITAASKLSWRQCGNCRAILFS